VTGRTVDRRGLVVVLRGSGGVLGLGLTLGARRWGAHLVEQVHGGE
jgi:hypothetical protein